MESEKQLKEKVDYIVKGKYSSYTIGVTDDSNKRKRDHGNPKHWHHWDGDTEMVARNVVAYLINTQNLEETPL